MSILGGIDLLLTSIASNWAVGELVPSIWQFLVRYWTTLILFFFFFLFRKHYENFITWTVNFCQVLQDWLHHSGCLLTIFGVHTRI